MLTELKQVWRKWCALQTAEQKVVLVLPLLLYTANAGMRVLGVKRMLACVGKPLAKNHGNRAQVRLHPWRYSQLTVAVARYCLPPGSCLPQALALCWLLRKYGFDAQIRIGVNPKSQPFLAHAWVELEGVALDYQSDSYKAFRQSVEKDHPAFL